MGEEFRLEEVKGFSLIREIYDWVEPITAAFVCMFLVMTFMGRMIGVDGDSMIPTLQHQDRLVISRLLYTPERGDIVVVTKPNPENKPLIKRVIATGGQTVDIDPLAGTVTVDGEVLEEPYIYEPTLTSGNMTYPATVPAGHVFVMGDNRNDSWDSRMTNVGMVDERYILGRIYFRVLPFEQMGDPHVAGEEEERSQEEVA